MAQQLKRRRQTIGVFEGRETGQAKKKALNLAQTFEDQVLLEQDPWQHHTEYKRERGVEEEKKRGEITRVGAVVCRRSRSKMKMLAK